MSNRPNIPFGSPSLIIIAVAFAPLIIKKCKPAVKLVGETLVKAGNTVQKMAH